MGRDAIRRTQEAPDGGVTLWVPDDTPLRVVQLRARAGTARALDGELLGHFVDEPLAAAARTENWLCRLASFLTRNLCPTSLWTNCPITRDR